MSVCGRESDLDAGLTPAQARRADLLWAAGVTVGVLLVFLVLNISKSAGVSILVAIALAYALDPVVDWLEARGASRTLATALLFVVTTVGCTGALVYLVPALGAELRKVPHFVDGLSGTLLPRLESLLGTPAPANVREAFSVLGAKGGGMAEKALPTVASVLAGAIGSTASVVIAVLGLLLIPVLNFYLLRDYDVLVARVRSLLPRKYERLVAARFAEVDSVLRSFISGQLTVGAILTVLYGIGLSLARIDLAVVIGAVAGFGTMIPYVGPACGALLALLAVAVSWQGPWQLVVVAATFGVAMTLEGIFITPRIVGGKVGLSALGVMIAILVFGELFGFVGVLLAVPVAAALKVVVRVVLFRYRASQLYRGSP